MNQQHHHHHSSIRISLILVITLLSSLSVVSNAWTMSSAVSSGSDTNNHKFRLPVPKRFHNNNNSNNNNKSQSKTERYFRNGVEEDESTIVMTPTQPPPPTRPAFVQSSSVVQPMDITMPVVVSTAELSPIGGGGAVTDNVLRTIDLPKHSSPAAPTTTSTKNNTMMWDLELILGRTAMVAGLIMLVGEVFFGVSPLVSLVGNS